MQGGVPRRSAENSMVKLEVEAAVAIDAHPLNPIPARDGASQLCKRDGTMIVTVRRDDRELGSIESTNCATTAWTVSKADGTKYEWQGKLRASGKDDENLEWQPANDEIRRTPLAEPQFAPCGFSSADVRTNRDLIGRMLQEISVSADHAKTWEIIGIDSEHGRAILRHVSKRPSLLAQRELQLSTMALLSPVQVTVDGETSVLHHLRNDRGGALFDLSGTAGSYTAKPIPQLRALPINLVRKTVGMIPIEYISGNVSHRRHNLSPVELHRLRSEVSAEFGDAEKFKEPRVGTDNHTGEDIFFCASRERTHSIQSYKQINCEDEVHDNPDWRTLELTVEGKTIIRYRPARDTDKHKGTFYELAEDQDGNPILRRDNRIFTVGDNHTAADRGDHRPVDHNRKNGQRETSFAPDAEGVQTVPIAMESETDSAVVFADEHARAKLMSTLRMFDNDQSFVEFLCKRIERKAGENRETARKELRDYAAMSIGDRSWARTEVVLAATELVEGNIKPSALIVKSVVIGNVELQLGTLATELLQHSQDATFFAPPPVTAFRQGPSQVVVTRSAVSAK